VLKFIIFRFRIFTLPLGNFHNLWMRSPPSIFLQQVVEAPVLVVTHGWSWKRRMRIFLGGAGGEGTLSVGWMGGADGAASGGDPRHGD
jgi:hypothetical protein